MGFRSHFVHQTSFLIQLDNCDPYPPAPVQGQLRYLNFKKKNGKAACVNGLEGCNYLNV